MALIPKGEGPFRTVGMDLLLQVERCGRRNGTWVFDVALLLCSVSHWPR